MMAEQKRTVGFDTGERGRFTGGLSGNPPAKSEVPPTLASVGIDKKSCEAGRKLQNDPMDVYDEYEIIDADTKRRLGRFIDLKSARNMAHIWVTPPHNHRSIEIWGVVITKTREQVETVTRTETEQRHQGEDLPDEGWKEDR
jgi:hypothetical protein